MKSRNNMNFEVGSHKKIRTKLPPNEVICIWKIVLSSYSALVGLSWNIMDASFSGEFIILKVKRRTTERKTFGNMNNKIIK